MQRNNLKTLASPFQFRNQDVRTAIDADGQMWFSVEDVCSILEIEWTGSTLNTAKKETVMEIRIDDTSINFINESGLYRLTYKNATPVAIEFSDWLFEVVIPTLRENEMI